MKALLCAFVVSLTFGCAASRKPSAPAQPARHAAHAVSPARIDAAFLATRGKLPTAEEHAQLAALPDANAVAKRLVDAPEVDQRLAPMLILDDYYLWQPLFIQPWSLILKSQVTEGQTVYFLDDPCPLADTVEVHPWWNTPGTVRVCTAAYHPERYALENGATCSSTLLEKGRRMGCGCGPNLAWCVRDKEQFFQLLTATRDEANETVGYASAHDWTLEQLFTSRDTFRRPLAEFEEQRIRLAQHAIDAMPDLRDWPKEGRIAPRYEAAPGQHAGLLTTPAVLFARDGFRSRMQRMAELLWCVRTRGLNTRAETLLHLGLNVRDGDGWQKLAAMPSCNECHARMDYAQQFFLGFPRSIDGLAFDPKAMRPGTGPIYLQSINDQRGEAPLNPASFVKTALQQPEFAQCMVQRVSDHFFGDSADPDTVASIRHAFDRTHQLRPMILAATAAYLEQPDLPPSDVAGSVAKDPVLTDEDPARAVPAPLQSALEQRCTACHLDGPLTLDGAMLPRSMLVRAATQVAMKTMPKGKGRMSMADRREMVHALVGAAFGSELMRAVEAERNLQAMLDYAPVQRTDAMLAAVAARAGAKLPENVPESMEPNIAHSMNVETPSLLLLQGVVATKLCDSRPVEQRKACLEQAFRVDDAVLEPLEAAPPSR